MAEECNWRSEICCTDQNSCGHIPPPTARRQSIAASVQKLPDPAASRSTPLAIDSPCGRRNDQFSDQFEVSRRYCTCNVHER